MKVRGCEWYVWRTSGRMKWTNRTEFSKYFQWMTNPLSFPLAVSLPVRMGRTRGRRMSIVSLFSHFEFRLNFHLIVRNFQFWFSLNQFHSISCCHYRLPTNYKKVFSKKYPFSPLMPRKPCFTAFLCPLSVPQLNWSFFLSKFCLSIFVFLPFQFSTGKWINFF